jgi:hypothetical protein
MVNDVEFQFDIKLLLNCLIKFDIRSCPFVLQVVPCVPYDCKFKYLSVSQHPLSRHCILFHNHYTTGTVTDMFH